MNIEVGLAPEVTFTALPFGGAVLVNGVTLGLAECAESDAVAVHALLSGVPATDRLVRLATALLKDGWLVASPEEA